MNRLKNETSPYLLQHADNPVDWYPWSQEAFDAAKRENKPIFLSIGYSTCHWCHVMERESFSDEKIAKIMNRYFVNIKVDREERPDIDSVYMTAAQAMTGSGGWPLSVFLTPEKKPFFAGTYFPPRETQGHPGFERLLMTIAQMWQSKRGEIVGSADKITEALASVRKQAGSREAPAEVLKDAYNYLKGMYDDVYGGFGQAPKFPQPTILTLLLNHWYKTAEQQAINMVEKTLDAMAKGGICDHIGGGFHRYATDTQWFIPHFEKMLYDQALLSNVYVQAYQVTGKSEYASVARAVYDYVLRDLIDAGGGFYAAEDADSEGVEGSFYLWKLEEIEKLLGSENAAIFNECFDVTDEGNYENGENILHIFTSNKYLAGKFRKTEAEIECILTQCRLALSQYRAKRLRPHRDDKIIAGWNGLMISSLAYAGASLNEPKYTAAADKAADFILNAMMQNGRLARYYRQGKAVGLGTLDDYALSAIGLLNLYQATFDIRRLIKAKEVIEKMMQLFADEKSGAFHETGKDDEEPLIRIQTAYDGPMPAATAAAAHVLLKLGRLAREDRFTRRGENIVKAFSTELREMPAMTASMAIACNFLLEPAQEIIISGDARDDTAEMLRLVNSYFLPNTIVLFYPADERRETAEQAIPFLREYKASGDKAVAFICENYTCREPIYEISRLRAELEKMARPLPRRSK